MSMEFEGSREEFLKFFIDLGEEPAFISRARAPKIALEALLLTCSIQYLELLEWPKFHWSILADRVGEDWSRFHALLERPEDVSILEELAGLLSSEGPTPRQWLSSDRTALRRFVESGQRFNRRWLRLLNDLDLGPTNKPRREFNQFYPLEKSCALGSELHNRDFTPLPMIDVAYLLEKFPQLPLPTLPQRRWL